MKSKIDEAGYKQAIQFLETMTSDEAPIFAAFFFRNQLSFQEVGLIYAHFFTQEIKDVKLRSEESRMYMSGWVDGFIDHTIKEKRYHDRL